LIVKTLRSSDGTLIVFDRFGEGSPLILVGGALSDRYAAFGLAQALSTHFAVYTYDRRGRGDSGDSDHTLPHALEREIEDLAAVCDKAGGSPFVFGLSSGASLALEAAASGVQVSKLAVYEPPYIVDDTRVHPAGMSERVADLIEAGRPGDAVKLFLAEGPQVPQEAIAGMQSSPMWKEMEAVAYTLQYDLAIVGDMVLPRTRLADIEIPVLALCGGESPAWARNGVAALAALLANARLVSLDGQSHGAEVDVLVPVLVDFF
jgi:pimeloyl-ACP methyl ester carboxylesterase